MKLWQLVTEWRWGSTLDPIISASSSDVHVSMPINETDVSAKDGSTIHSTRQTQRKVQLSLNHRTEAETRGEGDRHGPVDAASPMARQDATGKKRLLVYGMNFAPEIAGVGRYTGDIAEYLVDEACEVTVVTTPPHYPGWRVQSGYRNSYSTERTRGMTVHRAPLYLRHNMRGVWRLVAPLTFAVTSAPVVFWRILNVRPHTVFCVEPTLFAAPIALLAAKLVRAKSILHVQDLEVDAAFAVGHLSARRWAKKAAYAFEKLVLSRFDQVVTISNRMAEQLAEKGVGEANLAVVRNWVDLSHVYPLAGENPYRAELGYNKDDFIVLYSGNIGPKQGLHVLLEAASHIKAEPKLKFIVAGDGPSKSELKEKYGHLENLTFLEFQPYERFNTFLNLADLHVLTQDVGTADLVLPSKLGGMLASGKQIIVTADQGTELAVFLENIATITPAGRSAELAQGILAAKRDFKATRDNSLQLRMAARFDRNLNLQHLKEFL